MKTAFVTGAGRGLGRGFTDFLLGAGYTVFGGMRDPKTLDAALRGIDTFIPVPIDVTNDASIAAAAVYVLKHTDHLDLLVNNAGTNKDTATAGHKELVCNLADLDRNLLLSMFNVNAVSPIMVTRQFIPLLSVSPSFVINISSARSSYMDESPNTSGNYGYRASKAALNLMTFCSLHDLPENVRTFAVHPGSVRTDMNPTGSDNALLQAENIISITDNWKPEFNGKLLRFDGTLYPMD